MFHDVTWKFVGSYLCLSGFVSISGMRYFTLHHLCGISLPGEGSLEERSQDTETIRNSILVFFHLSSKDTLSRTSVVVYRLKKKQLIHSCLLA